VSVLNLKWIALFVQKLLGGPRISKLGHVTQAMLNKKPEVSFRGCFMVHMQEGAVLHLCTKFEVDCSIRSKVIKGVPKFGN